MKTRYIQKQIVKDLKKKMVFISGPRQVGKTTLAKAVMTPESAYLNWDIPRHRQAILCRELPLSKLWCFDEIHKYKSWRDYLKGLYDEFVTVHLHPIFVRFGAETNEPGAHLNGYSLRVEGNLLPLLNGLQKNNNIPKQGGYCERRNLVN
ncbi:MAG TPA: hypothetical protein ENK33_04645 [Desulfobacterales bacterium]|nr:hypothetical protein [Desulfobacterales bacterium]